MVLDEETRAQLAEALTEWLRQEATPPVVRHAEMALRGEYPVTVAHGTPETPHDTVLVYDRLGELAAATGRLKSRGGGSEHTTFVFAGEGAQEAAGRFLRAAQAVGPSWWKVTATSHPLWAW
jgi:hypothetical protein